MKIKISEYIRDFYCSNDQTPLVNYFLSETDNSKPFILLNEFFSFNVVTKEFYFEKSEQEEKIYQLEYEKNLPLREYERILKEYAGNFKGYDAEKHNILNLRALDISQQKEIVTLQPIPFKEMVNWTLLRYNKFHELLIKLGYPVCIHQNNFWWGELCYKDDHFKQIENKLNNERIDKTNSIEENFKVIAELFEEKTDEPEENDEDWDLIPDEILDDIIDEEEKSDDVNNLKPGTYSSEYKIGGRNPEIENRSNITKALKDPSFIKRLLP